ncbi:MAG: hypothetical protein PHE84_12850 [bacterium]|nr:hypothetical protein [bacterium]
MKTGLKLTGLILGIVLFFGAGTAGAQTEGKYVAEKPAPPADLKAPGWHPLLKAAANVSFSHNRSVVGNADGSNWNIGTLLNGGLNWLNASGHSWENNLKWQLNYTQTPTLKRFTKAVDGLDFNSTYLYNIPSIKWLGPFAGLVLQTPVFPGYDIRSADVTVIKLDKDGNQISSEQVWAKLKIDLTGPFAPALVKESAGVFADALNRTEIKLNLRAGMSAWEIWARDGYAVADNASTPELELKVIQDSTAFGSGLIARATGTLRPEVTYEAKAEAMYPFVYNIDTPLSGIDLLNLDFNFLLQVKLQKWLSLDYTFKALRLPFITDKWQIQNGVLLSATFELVK